MKHQFPKITNKELLEIFPESTVLIPQKIKEWEEVLKKEQEELKKCLIYIYSQRTDEFSTWFLERISSLFLMPPILEASRQILRLKRILPASSPEGREQERWQEKIAAARLYPIVEVARNALELKQASNNFISLCPFHNEKSPSFYIYSTTNTFHCFGCQESGDVIKLTMYLHGSSFQEAVKMLQ